MKLIIEKEKILEKLKSNNKVIIKNSPMIVLTNVLLEINNDCLKMTSSNGGITVHSCIDGIDDVKGEFKILLNCQMLLDSISKINSEMVIIELKDKNLIISGNKKRYRLNTMDFNQYPKIDDEDTNNKITVKSDDFMKGVISTYKTSSRKETRPILTGINIVGKKGENQIKFIATDSYRLSSCVVPTLDYLENDINIVVPYQLFEYIVSMSRSDDDIQNLEISFNDKQLKININDTIVKSKLVMGKYPNTDKLLLGKKNKVVKISKKDLEEMIDCSIFKEIKNYIITLNINDNCMTISNKNVEFGEFEETYENIDYNGDEIKVSLNGDYLKQALKPFESEYIEIKFEEQPLRPFVIKGCDNDKDNILQLLMPLRTFD